MPVVQAYCPECRRTVIARTVLDGDELKRVLSAKQEIEAMHTVTTPDLRDHRWNLNGRERRRVSRAIGME